MIRLLLVEDDQKETLVIKNMLKEGLQNQFTLEHSLSLSGALDLVRQSSWIYTYLMASPLNPFHSLSNIVLAHRF